MKVENGLFANLQASRGDLYFGFPVKRACVVVGTEELPDGFAFPVRSSTFKDARIVLADEAKAVLASHKCADK